MTDSINLLAIDPSLTETGICIFKNGKIHSEVIKPKTKDVARLSDISNHINCLIQDHCITHACIEGYAYSAIGRIVNLGELGGVIRLLLYDEGIPFVVVPPTVIKKFITGKGNAKKELMLLQVYKKFGVEFDNNNTCDAFALGKYVIDQNVFE